MKMINFSRKTHMTQRHHFKALPTSFALSDEQVDKLKDAAHRILSDSQEFQQFLHDLDQRKGR